MNCRFKEKAETLEFVRKAGIDWENAYLVTIRTKGACNDPITINNKLSDLLSSLNRYIFNRGFKGLVRAAKREGKYLRVVPFIEKNKENDGWHFHLIVECPSLKTKRQSAKNLKEVMRKFLCKKTSHFVSPTKFDKKDSEWFKKIDNKTENEVLSYAAKEIEGGLSPLCYENLYI